MTVIGYLFSILLTVILLIFISQYRLQTMVYHTKLLFRAGAVWQGALGSVISAWAQAFPDSAWQIWAAMPAAIRVFTPPGFLSMTGAFMVATAVFFQCVRQKNQQPSEDQ